VGGGIVAFALLPAGAAAASNYNFEARLSGSDSTLADAFGTAVAISGDVAVAGAPYANMAAGTEVGAAYVFVRSGATWTEQQKLTASDGTPHQHFGFSLALQRNTLVIGAPGDDGNVGAAYVFVWSGSAWVLQQKLIPALNPGQAGYSVSLSANTLAIGAPGNYASDGRVSVFTRSGSNWTEQQVGLEGTGILPLPSFHFGRSTSISGSTVIVGEEESPKFGGGAATVLVRSGSTWPLQQVIPPPEGAYFGYSVSVSRYTAAVGTLFDHSGNGDKAFVYGRAGSVWRLQQKITSGNVQSGDDFGSVLTVVEDRLLVGAPVSPFVGVSRPGAGYLFTRSGASWIQQQRFRDPAGGPKDAFGAATALSGNLIAFGAPGSAALVLFRGIDADLGVTIDDGQATAVPGMPVSYVIVVSNAGPDAASAVRVEVSSPDLLGVSWTCSASTGSRCRPSGTGALAESVNLAAGGSAIYTLTGTVDPAATGKLVSTATATLPPGLDPNPANNSATDTDLLSPVADLASIE
jgi:uncharacterized repeat protein (TIGR01451 family)